MFLRLVLSTCSSRLARLSCLLWALCLAPVPCLAGDLKILLVLSDSSEPYQAFSKAFQQKLPANASVTVQEHAEDFSGGEQQFDLVVTVGVKAGDWAAARTNKPLLAAMLPSNRYAGLLAKRPRATQMSAIFVDQPWARQVHVLRAALPGRKKIGLLHSPEPHLEINALRNLLAEHGAALNDHPADPSGKLFDDLESALSGSDVLLAVPDSAIYNGSNIRNILLSSYRHRVPLIGLSQAYVNAGALYAVYSTPGQLAAQADAAVRLFAQVRQLPGPQFPEFFSIVVNREVARMLGITIKPAEALQSQAEQEEGRR